MCCSLYIYVSLNICILTVNWGYRQILYFKSVFINIMLAFILFTEIKIRVEKRIEVGNP